MTLPKKTPGEFFEDLGMLTKLLTPGKSSATAASQEATKSLVEVIGGKEEGVIRSEGEEKEVEEEEEEWDWRVEQTVPEENTGEVRWLEGQVRERVREWGNGREAGYSTWSYVSGWEVRRMACALCYQLRNLC